jgi:hypothetical protein
MVPGHGSGTAVGNSFLDKPPGVNVENFGASSLMVTETGTNNNLVVANRKLRISRI